MKALERDVIASSGQERVQKLINITDATLAAGDAKAALAWAEEAEGFAKRLNLPEWHAIALNREAKIYVIQNKSRRAGNAFTQSNEVLRSAGIPNKNLLLDNLNNLQKMAASSGRDADANKLAEQIVQIGSGGTFAEGPLTRSEMREEISSLRNEITAYNDRRRPKNISDADWKTQSTELQEKLAAQEETIKKMSEEQVKSELLLMQQQRLVDSFSYQANLDSLAINNWNLELQRSESARRLNWAIIGILLLLAGGASFSYIRARTNALVLKEKNKIIRVEQERSENLLLNILPGLVAEELKKKGHTDARYFEDVSVLFADFVGFSQIAEKLSPQQLVTELDTCFRAFDEIIARHGIEKIKTIGDAYMCAGGLPNGGGSQLRSMVQAALEMQRWLADWNRDREAQKMPRYDARIGIHRGPVVAGVVGSKKFAFDIWGDTVNIASRIESAGESGKINVSGEVFKDIQKYFPCAYRGKIAAKNKGEIDMYFVEN
ncbi:MAG: hypothetical protein IPL65_19615 [Lewinellaceae bacterium]|nr:hypothetical protein [Lewinellaceae bacterium]